MNRSSTACAALAAAIVLGGCANSSQASSTCIPGQRSACPCPAGQTGFQDCTANATLESCRCDAAEPPDAGDPDGGDPSWHGCPDNVGGLCTWAGSTEGAGWNGDDHLLTESKLNHPTDVVFDRDSNPYVIDRENQRIRKVLDGKFVTVMGTGYIGDGDPNGADDTAAGALGPNVGLHSPTGMTTSGSFGFVVDWKNHKLRKIDLTTSTTHLWGGTAQWHSGPNGDGGPVASAMFGYPSRLVHSIARAAFFVIDQKQQLVRMIVEDGSRITTVAGTVGLAGYDEGGPYTAPNLAKFHFDDGGANPAQIQPSGGLAVDADGSLYVADSLNNVIRKITFAVVNGRSVPQKIRTVAGSASEPGALVDGPALSARFYNPTDLEVASDGMLYIADTGNSSIRRYDPVQGTVTTVAGNGTAGFADDGVDAKRAMLNHPLGIVLNPDQSHLFIADTNNHRIRILRLN